MPSFESIETSKYNRKPIELFEFVFGLAPEDRFTYTDSDKDEFFGGSLYKKIPIKRAAIATNGTLDKSNLDVTVSQASEIADVFRISPPSYVISLTIRQGHVDNPDNEFPVVWTGRALSCSRKDAQVVISCEPIGTGLDRPGLRRNYQRGCPFFLYGEQCRAAKTAFNYSVAAVHVFNLITVAGFNRDPREFVDGIIEWTSAEGRKEIFPIANIDASGNVQLNGSPRVLNVGDTVTMYRGCDRTMGTFGCQMHNNINNFGGQPWIPFKNPVNSISFFG